MTLALIGLSWLGFLLHNLADLPGQTPLSPETAFPTIIYLILIALWFTPARRTAARLLLAWALLQLIGGGIVSVLPLPFLPFDPEQTVYHYTFHAIYAITQIPLIVHMSRSIR